MDGRSRDLTVEAKARPAVDVDGIWQHMRAPMPWDADPMGSVVLTTARGPGALDGGDASTGPDAPEPALINVRRGRACLVL